MGIPVLLSNFFEFIFFSNNNSLCSWDATQISNQMDILGLFGPIVLITLCTAGFIFEFILLAASPAHKIAIFLSVGALIHLPNSSFNWRPGSVEQIDNERSPGIFYKNLTLFGNVNIAAMFTLPNVMRKINFEFSFFQDQSVLYNLNQFSFHHYNIS